MLDLDDLLLNVFLVLLASTYAIFHLDSRLDRFYVFQPDTLHAVSQHAVQQHGNDTAAVVASIVSSLRADSAVAPYLAVEEEWVVSHAGGAVGAMYVIHASESKPFSLLLTFDLSRIPLPRFGGQDEMI